MSAQGQLNCNHPEEPTVERTLRRWGEVNTQVVEWAKKHAYGS
jgi:hypothetical protein